MAFRYLCDGFFAADSPSSVTDASSTTRGNAALFTGLTCPVGGHRLVGDFLLHDVESDAHFAHSFRSS
jgi:hypothetical protein